MQFKTKNETKMPKNFGAMHLMRNFCRDYSKKYKLQNLATPISSKYDRKKTDSADKISKFLNRPQYSSINPTPRHKSQAISIVRSSKNTTQENKRCYFKSNYCQSHPFLKTDHKISPQTDGIRENIQDSLQHESTRKMTDPGPTQVFNDYCKFTIGSNELSSPQKNRQLVKDLKERIEKAKQIKRQKMKRIKYNYLVNNCYKFHIKTDNSEPLKKITRDSFPKTQENIFPSTVFKNQVVK